jgi:SET domain-containing protein
MLRVKTYLAPDNYGGTGLFADEDIAEGSVVWEFHPETTFFLPVKDYYSLAQDRKVWLEKWGYPVGYLDKANPRVGLYYDIDNSQYCNHSANPNTGSRAADISDVDMAQCEFALRDIKKGEEITSNYLEYDPLNIIDAMGIVTCKTFLIHGFGKEKKSA